MGSFHIRWAHISWQQTFQPLSCLLCNLRPCNHLQSYQNVPLVQWGWIINAVLLGGLLISLSKNQVSCPRHLQQSTCLVFGFIIFDKTNLCRNKTLDELLSTTEGRRYAILQLWGEIMSLGCELTLCRLGNTEFGRWRCGADGCCWQSLPWRNTFIRGHRTADSGLAMRKAGVPRCFHTARQLWSILWSVPPVTAICRRSASTVERKTTHFIMHHHGGAGWEGTWSVMSSFHDDGNVPIDYWLSPVAVSDCC